MKKPKSLTTKALLAGLSSFLMFVVQLIAGFFITPLIIKGLGKELYGTWAIIGQTVGYVALANLRVTSVIKYTLATEQHTDDGLLKRQQVGASLIALSRVIPIISIIGILVIWIAPTVIKTDPAYANQVRWAVGIGIAGIVLDSLFSIPANILRGLNLEYKFIGLDAIVLVLSNVLSLLVVSFKMGLAGLAIVSEISTLITGIVEYFIARKNVAWLGIARPSQEMLQLLWHRALWAFLASLGYVMQNTSDLLIVGIISGPAVAAIYGTTGLVLRLAIEPLFSVISAAYPGIAGLCGKKEWNRVEKARNEIHLMAFFILTILGSGILVLNQAFMSFWLGSTYYAGPTVNLLMVLLAMQSIPLRSDTMLMDGMLKFKARALSTIITSIFGILTAATLGTRYGLEGVALGLFLGRIIAIVTYQHIIEQASGIELISYLRWMGRPFFVGICLLFISYFVSITIPNIIVFFVTGIAVTLFSSLIMWYWGLNKVQRSDLLQRFGSHLPPVFRTVATRG